MIALIGAFWMGSGPVWAGGDWCEALGEMARTTAVARDAQVPMATCLQNAEAVRASAAVRRALRAQVQAVYQSRESPEQSRIKAVHRCQEAQATVEEDLRRRDAVGSSSTP